MSIPGLGDAITLFDLSVRVTTFINDLRHAQDDFISLRSEADCLRICLGSLTSESCQNALYHYITIKQGQDLKQIVDNCKFNMMDLNNFIAKCAKLGDNSSVTIRKKRDFFKKIGKAIGKGFTKFKFVMTDKQAFRDKLVLPAASINVFLTSMTHVGLVNMGRIMIRTGHGMAIPTGARNDDKNGRKAGVTVTVDALDGWQAVGRRLAFRDTIVKKSDLTADFEDEMLEYALHLIRGGLPFHVSVGTSGTKHKVTKTTSTKTRSRSTSRGPLGLGKGRRGQKYVMRKKSVSRPSTEKVEIVEREWESGSDSDRGPRRLLALPAPDASSTSRNYIEIKPDSVSGSEKGSDHSDRSDSGGGRARHEWPRPREERRRPSSRDEPRAEARRQPTTSREEIRAHRRDIRKEIRDEQEEAFRELEEEEAAYRTRRRQTRMSRPLFHSREEEAEFEREEEEEDIIAFLAEQYGVVVEPLPMPREPIDNGIVKDIPPPTASGVVESVSSDSEGSDTPLTPSPTRSRTVGRRPTNDRLRAQTYRGSVRDATYMPWSNRFEPYPDPYGPSRFRPRPRPHFGSYDERPYPPHEYGGSPPSIIVDEQHGPSWEHLRYPSHRDPQRDRYRRDSDDSDLSDYVTKRPPRGPGPGPGHGAEKEILIARPKDKEAAKRKSILKPGPAVVERRSSYTDDLRPRHTDPDRSQSFKESRHAAPRESSYHYDSHDVYMRGARSEDDSDGPHDGIEIVRQ